MANIKIFYVLLNMSTIWRSHNNTFIKNIFVWIRQKKEGNPCGLPSFIHFKN
jgi:hypothetical protein